MDGGWDILAEGLSEQGLADMKDSAVCVQEEQCLLWTSSMGTSWGLVRYRNPAASDTLGWGLGLCV